MVAATATRGIEKAGMSQRVEDPSRSRGGSATFAAIGTVQKLTCMVERLSKQMETVQLEASRMRRQPGDGGRDRNSRDQESRQKPESRTPKQQSRGFALSISQLGAILFEEIFFALNNC